MGMLKSGLMQKPGNQEPILSLAGADGPPAPTWGGIFFPLFEIVSAKSTNRRAGRFLMRSIPLWKSELRMRSG
jgi:hypothetical protein